VTAIDGSATPVPKKGLFEDFVDIFIHPRALFERNQSSSFVRPALVQSIFLLVLGVAAMNLLAPYYEAEMLRQAARQAGGTAPEGSAAILGTVAKVTAVAGLALSPWLIGVVGGLFTWIAARIVGARMTYGQSAMIAAWSYTPGMLGAIAMAVQGALVDPATIRGAADAQIGVARFLDPNTTAPPVMALLMQLDLFNLWGLVLTAIGITVVARKDFGTGTLAAIIRFALFSLLTLIPALLR
jgi:hypothetical protein